MDLLNLVGGAYLVVSGIGLALTILAVVDPDRVAGPALEDEPARPPSFDPAAYPSPGPASSIVPADTSLGTTGPAAATSGATPSSYARKLSANIAAS